MVVLSLPRLQAVSLKVFSLSASRGALAARSTGQSLFASRVYQQTDTDAS